MNNRPRGRQRNITGQGKNVKRRGAGWGSGPVGKSGRTLQPSAGGTRAEQPPAPAADWEAASCFCCSFRVAVAVRHAPLRRSRYERLNCHHRLRKSKNRLVEKRKCRFIMKVSKEVLV